MIADVSKSTKLLYINQLFLSILLKLYRKGSNYVKSWIPCWWNCNSRPSQSRPSSHRSQGNSLIKCVWVYSIHKLLRIKYTGICWWINYQYFFSSQSEYGPLTVLFEICMFTYLDKWRFTRSWAPIKGSCHRTVAVEMMHFSWGQVRQVLLLKLRLVA
jgi:hypothetical protein